jgi:hypothetical protein
MWRFQTSTLSPSTIRASISNDGRLLTFREVLSLWSGSGEFTRAWTGFLSGIPFAAYCWETPPLTATTLDKDFQCVFVESPALVGVKQEPEPFTEHFRSASPDKYAVRFESLGRDAILIAPCPRDREVSYAHLAAFVRSENMDAAAELWRLVASAVESKIGDQPIWLSTAGLGVIWLHVRVDSRPKYYRHRAYADRAFWNVDQFPQEP